MWQAMREAARMFLAASIALRTAWKQRVKKGVAAPQMKPASTAVFGQMVSPATAPRPSPAKLRNAAASVSAAA
jgi:hypothetical protein